MFTFLKKLIFAVQLVVFVSFPSLAQGSPSAQGAPTPETDALSEAPHLIFVSERSQAVFGTAYQEALRNLLQINTVPYEEAQYNRTGLLVDPPGRFIRAGGGYKQPWTRDASVNSWNAGSLLEPTVARNTLWSVVQREADGKLIVEQDNQWWDQVIWIIAAWNQYAVTGDRTFLADAYQTATGTLARDKMLRFRAADGLFQGPAFFNDGIAGYPVPPATPTEDRGSFVLDYPNSDKLMVLSTNCIYVEAYRSAAAMARELGNRTKASAFTATAEVLKNSINQHFWMADKHKYGYLISPTVASKGRNGAVTKVQDYQEGSGIAFALLFDIADTNRAQDVLRTAHIDPHGIVDVYPNLPRYSDQRPGRHNEIIWPMVEGFWALGAAHQHSETAFANEVTNLAQLAKSSSGHFYEIYNAHTGMPDGGWQTRSHWDSQPDQTWSATAYLAMIYRGLFGMNFTPAGIEFHPLLPANWGDVTLSGLRYRGMHLQVRLHGAGYAIKRFTVDGKAQDQPFVSANLTGSHTVEITLGQE